MTSKTKVLVTGASGMLGRSILRHISKTQPHLDCVGTGHSRVTPSSPLRAVDLLAINAIPQLMNDVQPNIVIHCAAERRPDCADQDPERTVALNVTVTKEFARECLARDATLIYISTDYVFDGGLETGLMPPYRTDAKTSPVNLYGRTKLDGERAVLSLSLSDVNGDGGADAEAEAEVLRLKWSPIVVRVPVLYAKDCEDINESASLIVAKALLEKEKTKVKVDHWGVRFPTLVDDVARCMSLIINQILKLKLDEESDAGGGRILHCSSPEQCTKYELVQLMGEIMQVDTSHIVPDVQPPQGAKRPQNTQLDCMETWEFLGLSSSATTPSPLEFSFTPLREGMRDALAPFSSMFQK